MFLSFRYENFFQGKMHSLLIEVDIIFELLDEHHYIAIFLHSKHMNMSKFARISFFLNDSINTFLYFEIDRVIICA